MLHHPRGQGTRLLLVDDDPIVREAVVRRLSLDGFRVESTGSVEEAVALAASQRFDAIIADFHMPNVDGRELIERLLAKHPEVPCVILTGDRDVRPSQLPHYCRVARKGCNFDQLTETLLAQWNVTAVGSR